MSPHRFFLTAPLSQDGDQLPLSDADVHHAVAVLRVGAGEEIEVVEPGEAGVWRVGVTSATSAGVTARRIVRLDPPVGVAELPHVSLFQGMAKGEKMDAVVRQAVEVGAERIVGVVTSRSVVRLDAGKRASRGERWRRIAKSAAEQSKRTSVPEVPDPIDFSEAVASLEAYDGVVVLWEDHRGLGIAQALRPWVGVSAACIAVFVGPEGGLSAEEVDALSAAGARVASLGPTILRTETAGIVALALAIHTLGGLGGSGG